MTYLKIKKAIPLAFAALLFAMMLIYSSQASDGAADGLMLCLNVIIPTLLPFMVLSNLLCALGLPSYLGRYAEGLFRSLFGVGGAGTSAFILGLTGGYPLGACTAADMYRAKIISKDDAEKLLLFCNNTGPAFIMGMAGAGIFHSAKVGIMLYFVHAVSASLVGMALCRGTVIRETEKCGICAMDLGSAVTEAMTKAVKSTAMICGFVVFFSMLTALMKSSGFFTLLTGFLCRRTPMSVGQAQSAVLGILELGSGIASLEGLSPTPGNLALCAFILGWGGISVQFQTAAVLSGTGIKCSSAVFAKAFHGVISAAIAYAVGAIL